MIFRISGKSILRMPFKTALFTLLIVTVTAFLYLGANTWAASVKMLRDCDENYTTIVSMEYVGENYPSESAYDEDMLSKVSDTDFRAVASDENVLLWQPTDCSIGLVDGFTAHFDSVPYRNYVVLVVNNIHQYQENGPYYGTLAENLYSYRPIDEGRGVYIYNDIMEGLDFEPDPDATYVLHGYVVSFSSVSLDVHLAGFYSHAAALAGVDCDSVAPYMKIDSVEALHEDPDNIYLSIADYYNVMNNKVYVYKTQAPADLEEFNQNKLMITSGRLFTGEEAASGAKVCVITQTLADNRELKVGDSVTLQTTDNTDRPAADCYWGAGSLVNTDTYTVVGIVNYCEGYQFNVYVPSVPASPQPMKYIYKLGQATVKNGTAGAFVEDVTPLLPARVSLNVYDQGYQAVADSLTVIRRASAALSAVALVATLVVLVFFAYLFVQKQSGTVETMRCFGTTRAQTRLYLIFGAGLIALIAVGLGVYIGTRYAQGLIVKAYAFVSELQTVDTRYSNGYLGITKEFTPVPLVSVPLALIAGGAVYLLSIGLCLYFAHRTIEGRLLAAKVQTQNRKPPKTSSTALSGAIRYTMLSIRRGGARSFIVPALAAVMFLFMATLQATSASYSSAREQLYDETKLRGYFTTMTGKFSDRLYIENKYAEMIADCDFVENTTMTYHKNYGYLGIAEYANGAEGAVQAAPAPDNAWALDNLVSQLADEPYLIFTNSVSDAPEFYPGGFNGTFLSGYSEASFAERDWTEPFCVVSTQFMAKNNISPGDTIRVYAVNGPGYPVDSPAFVTLDLKVVGSFYRQAAQDQIYCPFSLGALDTAHSTVQSLGYSKGTIRSGRLRAYSGNDITALTPQQLFDVLLDELYVSSCSFTVKDARELTAFKDYLEETGFSGPKQDRDIRVAVTIEDADFNESVSAVMQRSKYMEILYPILLVLACAVGAITAFLTVNSRREEIAVMRGMGTPNGRIFCAFFFEQAFLLLAGTLTGAAVWFALGGGAQLAQFDSYAFFLCYLLGAAASVLQHSGKKALYILSEKE